MTNRQIAVPFSEHCVECGGVFSVVQIDIEPDRFRLHLRVENTGECGELTLLMESSRVLALNAKQAQNFMKSYSWQRAQGRSSAEKYIGPETFFGLGVVNAGDLPKKLVEGQAWDGWFESAGRPLPKDAVALIAVFGLFEEQRPKRMMNFITNDPRRPFISLTGEEVTVSELSHGLSIFARVIGYLQCLWSPANRLPLAGGIAGVLGVEAFTNAPVSLALAGWFGGYAVGYVSLRVWNERRSRRNLAGPHRP